METVKDYIQYAKTAIHPRISDDASQAFVEEYVEMRKMGSGRGQVSAYPRQLESLIRLAEAHAKMRLSNKVEKNDVQEARRYEAPSMRWLIEAKNRWSRSSNKYTRLKGIVTLPRGQIYQNVKSAFSFG